MEVKHEKTFFITLSSYIIEKKVMNTKNKQKNKKLLEQAEKIVNNLSGYNKKIGKTSVKQLRQWVNKRDIANIPALLVGLAI